MEEDSGLVVVALVADLIFAARVKGAAPAGVDVVTGSSVAQVRERLGSGGAELLLVDLGARSGDPTELIAWAKAEAMVRGEIVAFGSHVDEAALAAARGSGADRVLARSAFVRALPGLLAELRSGS